MDMKTYEKHYIGGEWVASNGRGAFDVVEAATERPLARVPAGDASDVERAVAAAEAAFEGWSRTPPVERGRVLQRLQESLARRSEDIARVVAAEVGMPLALASQIQAGLPLLNLSSYAKLAAEHELEEEVGNSLVVREPVGVVGTITPWNYPLHQLVAKLAPALAAGCTLVCKPSEVAPSSAFMLAEAAEEAGLPPGIFNLVCGDGPTVGEAIASHPRLDMVSFTGSTRAGRRVAELASRSLKRVKLELGGKSANVILDDADLQRAVTHGVKFCFLNSGQTCSAWTRMLVPRALHGEAVEIAEQTAEGFRLGNPLDSETTLGPLVSDAQRARVREMIRRGIEEGATLVTGGAEPPAQPARGYFVRPTVFADVRSEMTIAQEEIFGPVLSILPVDDEEDAVRVANDSKYGLTGAVWSADNERAERVARRMRTGQVDINGGAFNPMAPFGGFKQSGYGREFGVFGLQEYLELKSLQR